MFVDFPNRGWPCRYRIENTSVKKMLRFSRVNIRSSFVNLLSLSSVFEMLSFFDVHFVIHIV